MNIHLKPEHEQFIQTQIATGKYRNASEVISKALKLLDEWEKGYQDWAEETRQKVEVAVEQLERGEGIDGEVVAKRLREKLHQETQPSQPETNLYPLHGKVNRYDDPTEPVVLEDWEVWQ
jgi:antitoxin ParD1/3/4